MTDEQEKPCVKVWAFYDAPQWMQDLSPHGGDEDWLVFVPHMLQETSLYWLDLAIHHDVFGACDTSKHEVPQGAIYIGAHS